MTAEQKLTIAFGLYYSAKQLKAASLKVQHPGWSENQILDKVKEIFLYAAT